MFVFSIFLPLFYVPFCNGDPLVFDSDADRTFFAHIFEGTMPGVAPNEDDDDSFDEIDPRVPNLFEFNREDITNETFDLHDYININEIYSNFTKEIKQPTRRRKSLEWFDEDDENRNQFNLEPIKKMEIKNCLIQYVMNCRYEVGKALHQRNPIRNEKRYKLGYLFNRMRRLKTEQLKMIGTVHNQAESDFKQIYSLLRLYERVVHFDVDMRHTATMIKTLFLTPDPCDTIVVKKAKSKSQGSNQTQTVGSTSSP